MKHKLKSAGRSLLCAFLLLCFLSACGADPFESSAVSSVPGASRKAVLSGSQTIKGSPAASAASADPEAGEADISLQVELPPLEAQTPNSVPVYANPAPGEILVWTEAGQTFQLEGTSDPLWYSTVLDSGATGYLYGESLFRVDPDGTVSGASLFLEAAEEKLATLKAQLPEGMYWNHMYDDSISYGEETPWYVTDIPCEHSIYGESYCNFYNGATEEIFPYSTLCECLGFASFLSDQLFGEEAPLHLFYDYSLLRVGDHIRLDEYEHSMTVVEVSEDSITIGEVNQDYEDCLISWSRQLSWYELDDLAWDSEYISRYPLSPAGDGTYVPWDMAE